ncbi:hypothetical protein SNE40_014536 [Patella caerulea]|uniref:UBX domain-containing protein n=1 Tax=Patella caerulea TaxID=87958 RepID=A0AAN8JK96_PATCE
MMARQSLRRFSKSSNEETILAPPGSPTLWSNQSEEGYFPPIPPPKPPSSLSKGKDSRPGSSRRRKYSASVSVISNDSFEGYDVDPFARRPSRPSSSLSKYKPLPDININHNKDTETKKSEQNVNTVSGDLERMSLVTKKGKDEVSAINKKTVSEKKNTKSSSVKNDERKQEKRRFSEGKYITLAIKIPTTGSRITKSFKETDTLHSVLKYAETECGEKLSHDYYLAVNMPRRIFENPKLTIKQTGLEDKTTLFLFEKDML